MPSTGPRPCGAGYAQSLGRMPGSSMGRTRNRRACRHQAGHHQQTVPVCFESS